jgi:hypothetical protein
MKMTEEIKKCLYQRMKTIINNENSDDTSVCLAALVLCMLLPMPTNEQLSKKKEHTLDTVETAFLKAAVAQAHKQEGIGVKK